MKTVMKNKPIYPVFTTYIPGNLEPGKVYISIEYNTVAHLCACGCGEKVITPLQPTAWKITYNGETVSLHPSIGNWSYKCRSHYWIRDNHVVWAEDWSEDQIKRARQQDARRNASSTGADGPNRTTTQSKKPEPTQANHGSTQGKSIWELIKEFFK